MISGYVIYMSVDRELGVRDFAASRFARLFPAYWLVVVGAWCLYRVFPVPGREVYGMQLINMTMLQSYFGVGHVSGVFWALHVELFFYGLVALCILFKCKRYLMWVIFLVVVWNFTDLMFREMRILFWREWYQVSFGLIAIFPTRYLCLFLLGMMLYRFKEGYRGYMGPLFVLILGNVYFYLDYLYPPVEQVIVIFLFTILFILAMRNRLKFLESKMILFLGKISYSLYLIHSPIGYVILHYGLKQGLDATFLVLTATLLSIVLGAVICQYAEKPMNRLIRGWYDRYKQGQIAKKRV